jgi:hypothetical protein
MKYFQIFTLATTIALLNSALPILADDDDDMVTCCG